MERLADGIIPANLWVASRVTATNSMVQADVLVDASDLPIQLDLQLLAGCKTLVAYEGLSVRTGHEARLKSFVQESVEPLARTERLVTVEGYDIERTRPIWLRFAKEMIRVKVRS